MCGVCVCVLCVLWYLVCELSTDCDDSDSCTDNFCNLEGVCEFTLIELCDSEFKI